MGKSGQEEGVKRETRYFFHIILIYLIYNSYNYISYDIIWYYSQNDLSWYCLRKITQVIFLLSRTCCVLQWSAVKGGYGPGSERPSFHRLLALHYPAFSKQEQRLYLKTPKNMYPAGFSALSGIVWPLRKAWTRAGNRTAGAPPHCQNVVFCKRLQGLLACKHTTESSQCKGSSSNAGIQRSDFQPMVSWVTCTLSILIPLISSPLYVNKFTLRLSR